MRKLLLLIALFGCGPQNDHMLYEQKIKDFVSQSNYEPSKYQYGSFEIMDTIQNIEGVRLWLLVRHEYGYPNAFGVVVPASIDLELVHFPGKECLVFTTGETGMNYPYEYLNRK